MNKKIFINLPVKDLTRTVDFFTQLGFEFNPKFSDEKAVCMIISESIYVMFLLENFFKGFVKREICDSEKYQEGLFAIEVETIEKVDIIVDKTIQLGAKEGYEPIKYDFMYSRSFIDLDGHQWEIFYMNPNHIEK